MYVLLKTRIIQCESNIENTFLRTSGSIPLPHYYKATYVFTVKKFGTSRGRHPLWEKIWPCLSKKCNEVRKVYTTWGLKTDDGGHSPDVHWWPQMASTGVSEARVYKKSITGVMRSVQYQEVHIRGMRSKMSFWDHSLG